MQPYEKKKLALRYYLTGKGYYTAAAALEFAADIHSGTRKDGCTPEFSHQISIAQYVRTLSVLYPELTIAVSLLHDVREDYNTSDAELVQRFGQEITTACIILDKKGKSSEDYYTECTQHPVASIVKPSDRIHNLQTMQGVFSLEKQRRYVDETTAFFFPLLKRARRKFPQQESAYENIKLVLGSQIQLIEAIHEANE